MEEGRPSSTAVAAAKMRAAHLLWDEPKILFVFHIGYCLCRRSPFDFAHSTLRANGTLNVRIEKPLVLSPSKHQRPTAQWNSDLALPVNSYRDNSMFVC